MTRNKIQINRNAVFNGDTNPNMQFVADISGGTPYFDFREVELKGTTQSDDWRNCK